MFGIIGAIILGAITGVLARAALPGTQNIGWGKTIGVGVIANLIVGIIGAILGLGAILSLIAGVAVGAGILYVAIDKGYLNPANGELNR